MALTGIWGHPFLDLAPLLDLSDLPAMHEEICFGLAQVETTYTGGSHRSMGIAPPSLAREPHVDYGEALRALGPAQWIALRALAEDRFPDAPEPVGEDTDYPLSHRQMRYLEYRAGVYFPWKVYYELLPNRFWHEKSAGAGKTFTDEARALFPKTVAFVRSLPMREVGWVKLLGLAANDHGTVHRDGDPAHKRDVDHFITVCPTGDKRLFLWDEATGTSTPVDARAYWFNDSDYHGVLAAPHFRYSLRIDGVFTEAFVSQLLARYGEGAMGGKSCCKRRQCKSPCIASRWRAASSC